MERARSGLTLSAVSRVGREPLKGWKRLARGGIQVHDISGEHGKILHPPHVQDLAEKFRVALLKAHQETTST